MGLVLDTLKIQNITDDVGTSRASAASRARRDRARPPPRRRRRADAAVQQAANWCASEIAKVDADLAIARQETRSASRTRSRPRGHDRGVEGQVLAQIAQVTAEIERQRRAPCRCSASSTPTWCSPRWRRQRAARRGRRGEAPPRHRARPRRRLGSLALLSRLPQGGDAARDVLVLQKLAAHARPNSTGSSQPLAVARLTVLPATQNGADVARLTISAAEQTRAVTGVDVAQLARGVSARLEGASTNLPSPPKPSTPAR